MHPRLPEVWMMWANPAVQELSLPLPSLPCCRHTALRRAEWEQGPTGTSFAQHCMTSWIILYTLMDKQNCIRRRHTCPNQSCVSPHKTNVLNGDQALPATLFEKPYPRESLHTYPHSP